MSTVASERDLCFMSIADLAPMLKAGEISPVEVTRAMLDRIDRHNEMMRVYITVTREQALEQAHQAEAEIKAGNYRGPLHGVTVSLKDNISTQGIRTSCASMVKTDWVPEQDATVYANLRKAGAILVGKANLNEYAFSMNPNFPPPLNPWHLERSPAGSSSGSGVGVAAGMVHGSIGSDTGGSGRAPANVNGCVGFKATYGRVSRYGVFPLSYSLDHTTMMTRTVTDSSIMLQATSGYDPLDENSLGADVPDFAAKLGRSVAGMKIGIARGHNYSDVDEDVIRTVAAAADTFRSLGAIVEEVKLPYVEYCLDTYAATMNPEVATIHYDNLRSTPEGFGQRARNRLDLGNLVPATAYVHAQRVRKLMRDGLREVFKTYDLIIGPASPLITGGAGEDSRMVNGVEVNSRDLGDGYTNYYSLTGAPALVLPAGFSHEDTPIGLQIAGNWFDEATILQGAYAFEQATSWHTRQPPYPMDAS
nr:J16 [uncultured bacterium]